MPVDPSSDRAVFRQIADELRSSIKDGTYGPGSRLPSENELAKRYDVTRVTVRRALGELAAEGLTVSQHGRGVFVRSTPVIVRASLARFSRKRRQEGDGAFAAEVKRLGMVPRQRLTEVGEIDPPDFVADALNLSSGEKVVVRRRVMFADDLPLQLADSYFASSLAAGTKLLDEDSGPGGSYARVEEEGHTLARFREDLTARMPTPEEARALQLGTGVPVVQLRRIAYDQDGRAVEVFDSVVAADKYQFTYEFDAPE
ncbi:GntR family transcriptional regulator [Saccharothrix sp. HUAS TT1]|uniref:GntR family transcriptional regulator n=1 Tax=unclassified Saccharothrix TaxID=2593673 RepID=UPI00345BFFBF